MLDFPFPATNGQTYVSPDGSTEWIYDGTKWAGGAGTGGAWLPLAGGTINPGPLHVKDSATNAPGMDITPIGMYDPLPNVSQQLLNANINMGQGRGGPYFNPTFVGRFTNSIYGSLDQSAVGLIGQVNFAGLGGVGEHSAVQAYANRYNIIAQPRTTVSQTNNAPAPTVYITDVSMFQMDSQPIQINGHGYLQLGHGGTSGPGSIYVDRNVPVADATVGNTVVGNNNPQLWGLNINVNDDANNTGVTSSKQTNYVIGCELDFACNGLDDAGPPMYGYPGGLRAMITLIGSGGTGSNPAEISDGIAVGPGGGSVVSWKRLYSAGQATFSQAAFDTRSAVQRSGANAVWLADGHYIAFDTAGAHQLFYNAGLGALELLGGPGLSIGGYGVSYDGVGGGGWVGFSWSSPNLNLHVNGASIGNVAVGSFLPISGGNLTGEVTISDTSGGWTPFAISNTSGNPCMIPIQSGTNHSWWIGAWGGGGFWIRDNTAGVTALQVPEGAGTVIVNYTLMIGGAGGPTWTTGTAAPSSTQPVGSLYSHVGGAVGATLYVSRGGGTWAAVAGV